MKNYLDGFDDKTSKKVKENDVSEASSGNETAELDGIEDAYAEIGASSIDGKSLLQKEMPIYLDVPSVESPSLDVDIVDFGLDNSAADGLLDKSGEMLNAEVDAKAEIETRDQFYQMIRELSLDELNEERKRLIEMGILDADTQTE